MKRKISYFYKTTNLINGRYYYGSGSKKNYLGSGKILLEAIEKYGKESFKIEILKYFDNREDAFKFEDRFLKLYKISEDLKSYNIKDCSRGGATIKGDSHPRPWKDKNFHSEEWIDKLKKSKLGSGNEMYGRKHSNSTREKMKIAWEKRRLEGRGNKPGRPVLEETRRKIGEANKRIRKQKLSDKS